MAKPWAILSAPVYKRQRDEARAKLALVEKQAELWANDPYRDWGGEAVAACGVVLLELLGHVARDQSGGDEPR